MNSTFPQEIAMAERIYEKLAWDIFRSDCEESRTHETQTIEGMPIFFPGYDSASKAVLFAFAAAHHFYNSREYRELTSD